MKVIDWRQMFSFEYKSKTIEYQVIKSNRKTVTISILPTKRIIVKTPKYLSDYEVMNLVKRKAQWIDKKISEMSDDTERKSKIEYSDGQFILYRGKDYKLKIENDYNIKKSKVVIISDEIVVTTNQEQNQDIAKILEQWYREKAKVLIHQRLDHYNVYINKKISNVRVKNQRRRWGSCSNLSNLNFNWRIIMMPDEMFDYIIVHEMCHLLHLNHSKDFWRAVEEILPDYKEREKWIKLNGSRLLM
jgi:predicted metal-dependent hydrolase